MKNKWIIVIMTVMVSLFAQAASTWRCQTGMVSAGNTQAEVVERCGQPFERHSLGWRRVATGYFGYFSDEQVEEWIYPVSDRLYYVLKFEGEKLKEVKSFYTH